MKRFKTRLPWIVPALILAALLVYGFWPQPVQVDIALVTRGSIDITVDDDGETRIREKYIVSAPVAGKLLRVQLHAGDDVTRGETELARIEPSDPALLDARTQAESQARLRAAEASVQRTKAVLSQATEGLELADHNYERAKSLLPRNAISQSEFDAAEHRYRIALADVRTADFGVKVAEFELEHARAAASRHDQVQSQNPQPFRLVSPIDGKVLRVFQEDAGVVEPGASILELGDARDLEIEIDVLSSDAVSIRPGQQVVIEQWGGQHPLAAVVRMVEPSAFLKTSALGVEEKRVNVIADFVTPWKLRKSLGDGFRIEARVVVASTGTNSLKVPAGALFREGDVWHVYRMTNGVAELCVVEPGQSNGVETEIMHGLSEGDRVVLHPPDSVGEGVKIAPTTFIN